MNRQDVFELMKSNPAFFLATIDGNQPRVRGMLLYRADESGIVFHTGTFKDVYKQIQNNPRVELCFNDFKKGIQLRVSGNLTELTDHALKDEIARHPSRGFLRQWKEEGKMEDFYNKLAVFQLQPDSATVWSMDRNFSGKEELAL
jgi:pyridoxamine 5'-phosphate oxidase